MTNIYCPAVRYAQLAAEALSYQFDLIDEHSGYLCEISNGDRKTYIGGGSAHGWPLNGAVAAGLATDKAFCADLLERAGIATPRYQKVFLSSRYKAIRNQGFDLDETPYFDRFSQGAEKIIVKPLNGALGAHVNVAYNNDEVRRFLKAMAARFEIALLQEYVEGTEYRVFVLDDDIKYSVSKKFPTITADGKQTVSELLNAYNDRMWGYGLDPVNLQSEQLVADLTQMGATLETVLAHGTVVTLSSRANLSAGGDYDNLSFEVEDALACVAKQAAQALGLRIAGVDIIQCHQTGHLFVLEINGNPAVTALEKAGHLDLIVSLYKEALQKALEE
ncbi:ATP-grasp domain-containing protein [Terasakiella sp. SH-1]|uniref:ATP-grasp domain-containing protein n=1 Tax=Terasakiella sp. SH-1 TaxID=2560057 RepID=UPI00107371C6|nr:ATP-grasp domain-containing protein [Terasakiella sp. SH-1]